MLASVIIKSALRKIGALRRGFSPSSEEMSEALEELNAMLAGWATKRLLIPYRTNESTSLSAGATTYTWGSGGNITSAIPLELLSAYITIGTTDYELHQFTLEEWQRIPVKSTEGIPGRFNYEYNDTLGRVRFDRTVQEAFTLVTSALKAFTPFSTISSDDAFPPHHVDVVRWNLAVRLAPERIGTDAPASVIRLAKETMDDLKGSNSAERIPVLRVDAALRRHRPFNINTIE